MILQNQLKILIIIKLKRIIILNKFVINLNLNKKPCKLFLFFKNNLHDIV